MSVVARLLSVTIIFLHLSACAGNNAMQWRPPAKPYCGVKLCEPGWDGKVIPERDCVCTGRPAHEVLGGMR